MAQGAAGEPARVLGPWELWPWCLADLVPEAARAANRGAPALLIWHFPLSPADRP